MNREQAILWKVHAQDKELVYDGKRRICSTSIPASLGATLNYGKETRERNAAMIAIQHNSHDALVEALEEVLSVIDSGRDFDCNEHNKAILVNALKLAKGEA